MLERGPTMGTLIEAYSRAIKQNQSLNEDISRIEVEIQNKTTTAPDDSAQRIERLEAQIVKIDDYLLRIQGFQQLAMKNLDSLNILTIEAPPGYRVNLNRLRNWAMMIDPMSHNDPYAQRVYVVSKCDECFLEKKKKEFRERIAQLQLHNDDGMDAEVALLRSKSDALREKLKLYAMSDEVSEFCKAVIAENNRHWQKAAPTGFPAPASAKDCIAPGAFTAPFRFDQEQRGWLKNMLGDYYDAEGGRVLLPAEIPNRSEYVLSVTCAPSRRKKLDSGLQNLVLSTLQANPAGTRKIYVLDGVRFNSSSMGSLRKLEGSYVMEQIPRNPDQLTALLEQIVSSFADMDETIEQYDSVAEYNEAVEASARLPLSTLILFGWPASFEGHDRDLLQRIMTNYERYGFSLVIVGYKTEDKRSMTDRGAMPEYAMQNAIEIRMLVNETTITFAGGKPQGFTWYVFQDTLPDSYVDSLRKYETGTQLLGNEYRKRYSLTDLPPYVREYKKIELPFGIDGKDAAHSLSFENENFATYLVGASRSGKSTLLHTLIAGLIRNYHPDNLELWLADFKQLEFKRYIDHLPPHVKYVLLDESTELVFDLVDKLTAEMMERQKLFARLGVQRIDQVDTTKLDAPLPVIFVILDEFSIMSQSIAESPIYKLRLQNILAKGAALGIKFLFSSQTFTTGVAGLSATARAQIQQRIAMKGSKEEISETLELSTNLKTEQVKNWMDALPPHYALVKFRISADTLPQVKRYLVMYFQDYAPRDEMIEHIRTSMHGDETYHPDDPHAYVDKHPVLVDGNTFDPFRVSQFLDRVREGKRERASDLSGDEIFAAFGTPRLMEKIKLVTFSSETRENLLLVARAAEQACAAAILLSAIRCAQAQNYRVHVWAYEKNRMYRTYQHLLHTEHVTVSAGMDAVCNSIAAMKKALQEKTAVPSLIVLIGMDRICMDFDFVDGSNPAESAHMKKPLLSEVRQGFVNKGAVVDSEDAEQKQMYAVAWLKRKRELKRELTAEGKSPKEIEEQLPMEERKFRAAFGIGSVAGGKSVGISGGPKSEIVAEAAADRANTGAYNAKEDFVYIIKQGSRQGCHFLLTLNSLADLKQCGLKSEFFRYKLAFQLSVEDSRSLFNSKIASALPEHICQFDDGLERYSFRPYLHYGIDWDGWTVERDGTVINPYGD